VELPAGGAPAVSACGPSSAPAPAVAARPLCARATRWLAGIVAAGVALRIAALALRAGTVVSTDEQHWHRMALAFLQGGLLSPEAHTYRPPLYPLLVAFTYWLAGPHVEAVVVWQVLMSAGTSVLAHRVGLRLGGERAGLLAAAATAAYPLFVLFAGALMAETLLVFLALLAVLAAVRWLEGGTAMEAFVLGIALGLACACKPVFLAWAPLLFGARVWWRGRARRAEQRCRVKTHGWAGGTGRECRHAAALLAGLALVLGPWSVRNAAMTGRWAPVSTNLGMNLLVGHEDGADGTYREGVDYLGMYARLVPPGLDPVAGDRAGTRLLLAKMWRAPRRTALLAARKAWILWSPAVTGAAGWPLAVGVASATPVLVLGLVGVLQYRHTPVGVAVGTLAGALTLVHALVFAHTRFRLPVDAALMGPAAAVLVRVVARARRTQAGPRGTGPQPAPPVAPERRR